MIAPVASLVIDQPVSGGKLSKSMVTVTMTSSCSLRSVCESSLSTAPFYDDRIMKYSEIFVNFESITLSAYLRRPGLLELSISIALVLSTELGT
jgi:hypothetical protein